MASKHIEKPGKGVLFSEQKKKSPQHPDLKGFVLLEMDYKAGEKLQLSGWLKDTPYGPLVSLSEDTYTKRKKIENGEAAVREWNTGKELKPAYAKGNGYGKFVDDNDDSVPF